MNKRTFDIDKPVLINTAMVYMDQYRNYSSFFTFWWQLKLLIGNFNCHLFFLWKRLFSNLLSLLLGNLDILDILMKTCIFSVPPKKCPYYITYMEPEKVKKCIKLYSFVTFHFRHVVDNKNYLLANLIVTFFIDLHKIQYWSIYSFAKNWVIGGPSTLHCLFLYII